MEPTTTVTVPIIVALVQLAKATGLSPRWAALLALGLGHASTLGPQALGLVGAQAWASAIAQGLGHGLAASGLYSVARAGAQPALLALGRPNHPQP